MAVEKFSFESLATIDEGRIREAFNQAMKRIRDDCYDRPGVEKAREVKLVMKMAPLQSGDGSLHSVEVWFEIDDNLPKRGSARYNMRAAQGGLVYNELAREDAGQKTLDDFAKNAGGGR